jgi:hypothetical protein
MLAVASTAQAGGGPPVTDDGEGTADDDEGTAEVDSAADGEEGTADDEGTGDPHPASSAKAINAATTRAPAPCEPEPTILRAAARRRFSP